MGVWVDIQLVVAIVLLVILLSVLIDGYMGFKSLCRLEDVETEDSGEIPLVSIIIPAMNEGECLEKALGSVLALDYAKLEIIAINDRSSDNTGEIMERLARDESRIKVIQIQNLPGGWLGKNHALMLGASKASGELLLFTDGDVVMEKSTLNRAVNYLAKNGLDHLAIFFDFKVPGALLNMLIIDFGLSFLSFMKPWKAKDPVSRFSIGIGAFNLVRAEVYKKIGTHQALSMHPVDDVELGRQIKKNGFRQDCVVGSGFISVRWYGSVMEMARGLEKNIFPFCNYSVPRVMFLTLFLVAFRIWPLVAVIVCSGAVQLVYGGMLLMIILLVLLSIRQNKAVPFTSLFCFPLSPFVTLYIVWRSVILAIVRGGIIWRRTFYPLAELKQAFKGYK